MFRPMKHVSISLSDEHQAFVERQVEFGGHADASAFLATLVEARVRGQSQLETLLLDGLDSEELEWTPELLDEIKRDAGLTA